MEYAEAPLSEDLDLERALIAASMPGGERVTHARLALPARVGSTFFRFGIHLIHIVSNLVGDDVIGRAIRRVILKAAGATLEREATVHGGTYLSKPSHLTLGYHCMLNRNCYLDLEAPVTFGDYSGAGHGATFITTVHQVVPGMNVGVGTTAKPITIGERAWIGANVTVLPGVTIGHDAIVAAGTLVTKDVPPNALIAGVPGRVLRSDVRHWLADIMESDEVPTRTDAAPT